MSGATRAGLICGAAGIVAVLLAALLPGPAAPLAGPLLAMIGGALAGIYALRWSPADARVWMGVRAGALAGVGLLIGSVAAFLLLFVRASADPLFQERLQEALQQQPDTTIAPETLALLVKIAGVVAGLCFGVLDLLLALAFGALGGWLVVRRRPPIGPSMSQEG